MARGFRESRFRRRGEISEDVNPSAYIVNLADCMLVLACGFLVALVSYWNIDISPEVTDVDRTAMEEVDPESLSSQDFADGSYYVETGTVYQDPNTGQYFMVEEKGEGKDGSTGASKKPVKSSDQSGKVKKSSQSGQSNQASKKGAASGSSNSDAVNARAMGAD